MKEDNSTRVLQRIYDASFKVLRDKNHIPLNVSYTEDGLKVTTDNLGRKLYGKPGTYVETFRPDPKILQEKSFRSKCEKRWTDKANSMLYEQRT